MPGELSDCYTESVTGANAELNSYHITVSQLVAQGGDICTP